MNTNSVPAHARAVVVGGGVIGCSTAYHLAKLGWTDVVLLERKQVPLGPVVLGIILGGPLEEKFIQSLTSSDGNIAAFFSRPAAAVLGIACLALWVSPLLLRKKARPGETTK